MIPTLAEADIRSGTRVLLRGSLNVPVKSGYVYDAFRLEKLLPTLSYLKERGAITVLVGHIGRDSQESLRPVYRWFRERMDMVFVPAVCGNDVDVVVRSLRPGECIMLENLRQHDGEENNDFAFARQLALYGSVYVNDAFAASHRKHASIVSVPRLLPHYAGMRFTEEYEALRRARTPATPSFCIIGGAKFETKEPLIAELVERYDSIFIGGALANDFLKGRGFPVGVSKVSARSVPDSLLWHEKLMLPEDVVVDSDFGVRTIPVSDVREHERIMDVGPESIAKLAQEIRGAESVLWNGPTGYYEGGFVERTLELAEAIGGSGAHSVVGGGDTIAVLSAHGMLEHFSFVSTAGGAMLDFLADGKLPGVDALLQ